MDKEFCIKLHSVNEKNSPKWLWAIILFGAILLLLIHRYNTKKTKEESIQKLQTNMNKNTEIGNYLNIKTMNNDGIETFRDKTSGVPRNVFHSNWPYPPYPLEKYRFCGNDDYCNPGHQCSDKLYGAMFPPVCACYITKNKDILGDTQKKDVLEDKTDGIDD